MRIEVAFRGQLTVGQATELLELSVYDVHRLAREHGVELGATAEAVRQAHQTARKLRARA